jgi:hypothetical protein
VPAPGDYDDGEIGGIIWQGKPKYPKKTCPSAALSTTNRLRCPDSNPDRRGGKPATNRFSYGTARCRSKVFEEQLPSNNKEIHIMTHGLMGGIYEVRRSDGHRYHDILVKFHKDWFSHPRVDRRRGGGICREHGDQISLLSIFFSKMREVG